MIRGLIFDFDGLIVDTEGPEFEVWEGFYREYGCELPFEVWAACIGTSADVFDPYAHLESLAAIPVPREALTRRRHETYLRLLEAQPLLPGVLEMLREARRLNLKVAIASSSSREWVTGHLHQRGAQDWFHAMRCSDDVDQVKPHPALYLAALDALGLAPEEAIAFEDSPNGVKAARAAGLFTVAVPNIVTARLPLDEANLRVASLADLSLPALLEEVEQARTAG